MRAPVSGREQPGTERTPVPGWHLWTSDAGRPHATRTGQNAQYDETCVPMTVDADTEGELLAALARYELQER